MNDLAGLTRVMLRTDLLAFERRVFRMLEPSVPFLPNWHFEHQCWALSRAMCGGCRRLIINVPPRSGKSILVSVAWPLFLLGHDPRRRIIAISHTEDLARKFSVDRRTVAQSRWYRDLFPGMQLASRRPSDLELKTTSYGSCLASGVGGAVLGRGADFIIVDDPIKALNALSSAERRRVNEFYDNTLLTRLNDKRTGVVVIVMQRLHADDLIGHVLDRDTWEVISLPAIATEDTVHQLSDDADDVYRRFRGEVLHEAREPREILEEVRRAQGSMMFQAQYQQDPVPPGGNVIQRSWLRFYEETARPRQFDQTIVSWDTASTLGEASDYSVGTVWGALGTDYYLLDVARARHQAPSLRQEIIRLSAHYNADATLIEDTELGRALAQDLRARGDLRPLLRRARFDKEARLLAQSARFEAGQVHLPNEAPWLADYVNELLAFPTGRHDDQVDSTSQALAHLTDRERSRRPMERRDITRRSLVRR